MRTLSLSSASLIGLLLLLLDGVAGGVETDVSAIVKGEEARGPQLVERDIQKTSELIARARDGNGVNFMR